MSLRAAQTCDEGVFQYCNYGYDRKKYISLEDCMTKEKLKCNSSTTNSSKNDTRKEINKVTDKLSEAKADAINFEKKNMDANKRRKNMTMVLIVGVVIIGIYFAKKKKLI